MSSGWNNALLIRVALLIYHRHTMVGFQIALVTHNTSTFVATSGVPYSSVSVKEVPFSDPEVHKGVIRLSEYGGDDFVVEHNGLGT